ncbi:MAG: fatty acid desaturase [Myxococcota bacterium]
MSRPEHALPVPGAANAALVAGVAATALGLLAVAANASPGALVGVAIAYAAVFQLGFALLHEAAHRKLHPDPRMNRALGLVVGTLFGMSVTMFGITHWSHHLKNRADEEAYDQVGPGEVRWKKAIGWYGMLLGLWYWVIWPANLLILVAPGPASRLARRIRIADAVFDAPPATLRAIRAELLGWAAAVTAVAIAVGPAALALQVAAAWVWSSSNYVEHAYAPRDVATGAFDLRAPRLWSALNLHRELDRTHHRWPDAPWTHLPRLSSGTDGAWLAHWLGQWRGPVRAPAPGPRPLAVIPETPLP